MSDKQFDELVNQMRLLYSNSLLSQNPFEEQRDNLKDEIQEFRKQKRRIANYTVDKGSSVKYKTIQNQDCAYVQMAYFMKENGNYTKSFQEYILVKENGKWKILSFQKNVSKDESKTEEQSDVTLLAIESSCDETAAAIVVNGRKVLSNVISSQIDIHKLYGGVVPEIASRKHIEQINQVIEQAFVDAEKTLDDVDGICVTYGPGLVGALLVGVGAAKAISYASGKTLIGVHHIEGHI